MYVVAADDVDDDDDDDDDDDNHDNGVAQKLLNILKFLMKMVID